MPNPKKQTSAQKKQDESDYNKAITELEKNMVKFSKTSTEKEFETQLPPVVVAHTPSKKTSTKIR